MDRGPATSTQMIDDDLIRVTRWDFEPNAETGWHRHVRDYVVVPMTDCSFLLEEAGGERRIDVAVGSVYRRNAGVEHKVVNGGERPMSFIEIEMKSGAREQP
jgi:quercetin dioxygenase-like cupin family protein